MAGPSVGQSPHVRENSARVQKLMEHLIRFIPARAGTNEGCGDCAKIDERTVNGLPRDPQLASVGGRHHALARLPQPVVACRHARLAAAGMGKREPSRATCAPRSVGQVEVDEELSIA